MYVNLISIKSYLSMLTFSFIIAVENSTGVNITFIVTLPLAGTVPLHETHKDTMLYNVFIYVPCIGETEKAGFFCS